MVGDNDITFCKLEEIAQLYFLRILDNSRNQIKSLGLSIPVHYVTDGEKLLVNISHL